MAARGMTIDHLGESSTADRASLTTGSVLLDEIARTIDRPRIMRLLADWVDPEAAFLTLFRDRRDAAWLDAGFDAESGWTYLGGLGGLGYVLVGNPGTGLVEIEHPATSRHGARAGSLLDALDAVPRAGWAGEEAVTDTGEDGCDLGWFGWIGYETGAAALGVPFAGPPASDSAMLFVDQLIAFDHVRRRVELHTFDSADGRTWLDVTERQLAATAGRSTAAPEVPESPTTPAVLRHSRAHYRELVVACQREIVEGEAYQLCLTNQITVRSGADPVEVFRRLRRVNPSPRGGLILVAGVAVASSSPELFLRVSRGGRIETRPIKGTRPRGATAEADDAQRDELLASAKEQAENLMIVDLMRNDLSRVAVLGSVRVPALFDVERYANVFQLVSTVTAQLSPGMSAAAAVRSAFPAGSMTGAPKLRAMSILSRLEEGPRGAYAGAFGSLGSDGRVELSMTIRAIVFDRVHGVATIGTGGGVTALSVPVEEVDEMILKAQPMLQALGARIPDDA
jgi:para-aminobenzoate synthetase component 1